MKLNKYLLLLTIIMVVGLSSCKKEDIPVYNHPSYLYFTNNSTDSISLSFFFYPGQDIVTIPIEIKLIGEVSNVDREYSIEVNNTTTLSKSNFILPDKPIFRANHAFDTLFVQLINDPSLKTEYKNISLSLVENGNFKLGMEDQLTSVIVVTDQAVKPDWWDPNNYVEIYGEQYFELGRYTDKKYSLFIEVTGISDLGSLGIDEQRAALRQFKYYLIEQKNAGNEILEDDGTPMTVFITG